MKKMFRRMITWGPIIYPFAKKLWEKRKQSKVNSTTAAR